MRLRSDWFVVPAALSLFALVTSSELADAQQDGDTLGFASELSRSLLGSSGQFYEIGSAAGWRGIVLVQPGTSIAPLVDAMSGVQSDLLQGYINAAVFDRPVSLTNGYAVFGPVSLDVVWADVLDRTMPARPLPLDRMLSPEVMRWLFAPIIRNGRTVGYSRERSRYMQDYLIYEELYRNLLAAERNGVWHLLSEYEHYQTFEEARSTILSDWLKSGYRAEIDTATWMFQSSSGGTEWQDWSMASFSFEFNRIPLDRYITIPQTYLFPSPASWASAGSWIRMTSRSGISAGSIRYQLARIQVVRPWFTPDLLVEGNINFDSQFERNIDYVVSNGMEPNHSAFPTGELPAYVEELILVRQIDTSSATYSQDIGHPLALFVYPNAVNLVGFVVRVLPRIAGAPLQSISVQ